MDTLCIPVDQQMLALRLAQIDSMASIFLGSTTTLVLDAELMAMDLQSDPLHRRKPVFKIPCPLRARIISCAWMSRSWTLQEGALAPSLNFQLRNRAVGVGSRVRTGGSTFLGYNISDRGPYEEWVVGSSTGAHPAQGSPSGLPNVMVAEEGTGYEPVHRGRCSSAVCQFQDCLRAELFNDKGTDIVRVWNALAGRTTTKTKDLPLILANLLDLKTYQLVRYGDRIDPYEIIFRSVFQIPFSLLFHQVTEPDPLSPCASKWVPNGIGRDLLSNRDFLQVRGDYLWYSFSHSHRDEGLSMYTTPLDQAKRTYRYLYDSAGDTYYSLEPSSLTIPMMNGQRPFEASELRMVIDHEKPKEHPSVRRGACFVVHSKKTALSPLKLDFLRGLSMRMVATPSQTDLDATPALRISYCSVPSTIAIRTGERPQLEQPLSRSLPARISRLCHSRQSVGRIPSIGRHRSIMSRLEDYNRWVALGMFLSMLADFLCLYARLPEAGIAQVFIACGCAGVTLVFLVATIAPTNRIRVCWRLRLLESIAKERSQREGSV